jgi:erythromycin esterase-like protein
MFFGDVSSWNVRDAHMTQTFDNLVAHLGDRYGNAKVVIWAHNSHIGDARATAMGSSGEWNVGQLIRQKYGRESCAIGFTAYAGTVTAASEWGAPAELKRVRPARPDSYEGLFHEAGIPAFLLQFVPGELLTHALEVPRRERAIGVIYKTETELSSHYFTARLADQFVAVIHFEITRAVEPLEAVARVIETEPAETYPLEFSLLRFHCCQRRNICENILVATTLSCLLLGVIESEIYGALEIRNRRRKHRLEPPQSTVI